MSHPPKSRTSSATSVRLHIRSAAVQYSDGEEHDTQRNRRMVAHVVKLMATKEDLADLKHNLKRDIASLHA
jgi:hypothetical protein